MQSTSLEIGGATELAFAASDLLVTVDVNGRIVEARGDGHLLHHPTPDRLLGKNAIELLNAHQADRLREDMWALGPGRRLCWDDADFGDGGRRIVVQRSPQRAGVFHFSLARIPTTMKIRSDRAEAVMAEQFRDAVMNGRLKAARQPVVNARTGAVSHFEVLARFDGEQSPQNLISAAEKTGMICHLDYIMVAAACARLASSPEKALRLAVNVSGDSIQRMEIIHELQALVSGHDFDPSRLIIEVTESAEILDVETAARAVSSLRSTGVSVSLDDFGAGSASFGYLRAFDVNGLKFDGSFLKETTPNVRTVALMRSVARMCAELGIAAVGERVETDSDRKLLIDAGVNYAQGYFFGKPAIDESFFTRGPRSLRAAA